MSQSGYRTLRVDGAGVATVTEQAIDVLEARAELDVRHLGEGRIGVSRTFRPTWALVMSILLFPVGGVGLLFLLVKKTEAGEVVAVDGATGSVVTVPPIVSEAACDQLSQAFGQSHRRAWLEAPSAPVVTRPPAPAAPPHNPPAHPPAQSPAPPAAPPTAPAAAQLAPPTGPAAAPTAPAVAPPAAPVVAEDPIEERTIRVGGGSAGGRAVLWFETGSIEIVPGDRVVLGRDPAIVDGARPARVPGESGTVSKSHALATFDGSRLTVRDLHSTNGTRIHDGGKFRVVSAGDEVIVPAGARIEMGTVSCAITVERPR